MPPSPSAGAEGGLKPVRSRAERPPPAAPTHRRRSAEAQRRMRARGGRSEHVRGGRACLRNGAAAPHPAVPPPLLPPFTLPYLPLHPFPPLNPLLAAHRPDAGPAPTARLGLPSEVSRCPARHSTARHGPARRRRSLPRLPHAAGPGRSAGTRWQPPAAPGTTLPRVPSPAAWAGGGRVLLSPPCSLRRAALCSPRAAGTASLRLCGRTSSSISVAAINPHVAGSFQEGVVV